MHHHDVGRDIVILTCGYGGGHQRVAQVLADELQRQAPECQIDIIDWLMCS
jgi:UDP-N-acetylglucosamine:LPS N-acetylglucosamine transferase